ncbi:hypothetical protein JVT61DRAFT_12096 [Boletus reticuloceps]|uniref:G domain-containing protein n=1 Tax=Boletus reticuloceps TaxID=495285 RepID=A0A8I2YEJ2_9AGAM|nr:hypothetical protein JVT61DRAFT_12096 [Boletus reticuloceps]
MIHKQQSSLLTPLPSPSLHLISRNIVVTGETSIGKSSFINLVIGSDSTTTANNICGITTHTNVHPWETDTHAHRFRLWDTPSLGEGLFSNVSPRAVELAKEDRVHLLVLCMRGIARIIKGMKETYDIVLRICDQVSPHIPIVAIMIELEKQCNEADIMGSMEEWWMSNASMLTAFGMTFCDHACLTTLSDNCHPQLPCRPIYGHDQRPLQYVHNIIIVGETGVGKSSIINQVVGTDSAIATSNVHTVTVGTSYHNWNLLQSQRICLWDTPGLDPSPSGGTSPKHVLNVL